MGRHLLLFFFLLILNLSSIIPVNNEVYLMGIMKIIELKKMDMKDLIECTCKYL
ncbi:hypothetical protein SRABI134_05050 [Peribacillus sp. Bi134]|nr:hypothetical protein SRABI134_05050 [Peribacillus sp. Bi134]